MKKKVAIPLAIMAVLIAFAAIWYHLPKTFGKNVAPSEVACIEVFDGNTGVSFTIDDPKDIQYIVENIQSKSMKKDGISLGKMGYGFKITWVDENGNAILSELILNGEGTVRSNPFFYKCDGGLCFDYLTELENRIETINLEQN